MFHLRVACVSCVDNMLLLELRPVTVETVGDEDGNVVQPVIARGSAEQDPAVMTSDLQEGPYPFARPNQALLVEDEEATLDVRILIDVVPAVDRQDTGDRPGHLLTHAVGSELAIPVEAVPLLG